MYTYCIVHKNTINHINYSNNHITNNLVFAQLVLLASGWLCLFQFGWTRSSIASPQRNSVRGATQAAPCGMKTELIFAKNSFLLNKLYSSKNNIVLYICTSRIKRVLVRNKTSFGTEYGTIKRVLVRNRWKYNFTTRFIINLATVSIKGVLVRNM